MYHTIYKTTNIVTGNYYIGVHSTKNKNDSYLGSGTIIKNAIKIYGRNSFKKEILECFDSAEDAYKRESEIVNEKFISDNNTYNISVGGLSSSLNINYDGTVSVKDKDGNNFRTSLTDPRYLSGELVGVAKNTTTVKDENGCSFRIPKDDPRYLSGELVGVAKNTTTVKDENGKTFRVSLTDPRYLSGELVGTTKGNKLTKEHKTLISQSSLGHKKKESTKKKMSQFAKNRIWINKDGNTSHCTKEKLQEKQNDGWKIGRK